MNRIIYDRVDLNIAVGQQSDSQPKSLKKGKVIGVKMLVFSDESARTHAININVTDGNNTLLGSTDFRDFTGQGGGYKENFKPCEIGSVESVSDVTVDANATQNLAGNAFSAQMIFMIEVDC